MRKPHAKTRKLSTRQRLKRTTHTFEGIASGFFGCRSSVGPTSRPYHATPALSCGLWVWRMGSLRRHQNRQDLVGRQLAAGMRDCFPDGFENFAVGETDEHLQLAHRGVMFRLPFE